MSWCVRPATYADLPEIYDIIDDAKKLLAADGSSQWQHGYPSYDVCKHDIDERASYVVEVDGRVAATAVISYEAEAPLDTVTDGEFAYPVSEFGDYAVLHRAAMSPDFRGQKLEDRPIIDILFYELFSIINHHGTHSVRIDTHTKNLRMQRVLERIGMKHVGTVMRVYDTDDPVRLCYEGSVPQIVATYEHDVMGV